MLFSHKTKWGKTALFNIPPTAVRRECQFNRVAYGRDSISELDNKSIQLILRHLSRPAVETDSGKIIAFQSTNGRTHIIVEEDSWPFPSRAIKLLVTINIPRLSAESISCNRAFSIVEADEKHIKLRLSIPPDEFAIITLDPCPAP